MSGIPDGLARRIDEIAADRESGASEILDRAVGILSDALESKAEVRPVALALCRAQPTMASLFNAALEAMASTAAPGRFERFIQRVARASAALARHGAELLASSGDSGPVRIVTISSSRSVSTVLQAVHQRRPVHLACSEGRPALEGRRLATTLAGRGMSVTYFTDAAIGRALGSADAVLVGADAIAPTWFLNKSGTRMLTAAASQEGVPVYVVGSRDKFVSDAIAARLAIRDGAPQEIWDDAPAGVTVRNPYFEPTPIDLVTGVISDMGVLGAAMVPDVCRSMHDAEVLRMLDGL